VTENPRSTSRHCY